MNGGMTWMWLWWIPAVFVLGAVGLAAARLLRSRPTPIAAPPTNSGNAHHPGKAERLLDERYARGEVDEDQYLQTRDRLRDS